MITISKTVRISEETHAKIQSVMSSYGQRTLGEAINYCVNQLFLEDEVVEEPQQPITERDDRDIEEIGFLRELALAQANSRKEIIVNVSSIGGGMPLPLDSTPILLLDDGKKGLSEEEIKDLQDSIAGEIDSAVQELDAIYTTGNSNPSNVLSISAPTHKDATVESREQYDKRIRARIKAARRGKLQPEKIVLRQGIEKSMEETKKLVEEKKLVTHPSGLPPPGPSEE